MTERKLQFLLPSLRLRLILSWIAIGLMLGGCFHAVEEIRPPSKNSETNTPPAEQTVQDPTTSENNWSCWRGAGHDNHAVGPQPPVAWSDAENIVWKSPLPGRGHATPIVWDDQLFVATAEEDREQQSLIALDRDTGEQRWQTVVHQGNLPAIHQKNSHASATPATDGIAVYTAFAHAGAVWVSAVDFDGNILWQTEAGPFKAPHGYGSSPVLFQSLVIVQSDNSNGGFLAAVDRQSGKIVWRVRRARNDSYATPIVAYVAGRDQLLTSGQNVVVSYDPTTGEEIWRCAGPAETTANTMAFRDDVVFASGGYSDTFVMAIRADGSGDVTATHLLWKEQFKMYVPSGLVIEDRLLVLGDNGVGVCYSAIDGQKLWKERIGGGFSASPVLIGDVVYAPDEKGVVHVFRALADKREKISQNHLNDGGMASPVIVGGRIYLRTDHYLYCIGDADLPEAIPSLSDMRKLLKDIPQ